MLLSEFLSASDLELLPLHLPDGATDFPIGRVVTTALLEPGQYLRARDLVLTELVWRRGPEDSEAFVASATEHGPVVIFAGTHLYGDVPEDLVRACRSRDVPLVAVPRHVPFTDVSAHAVAADVRTSASLSRQREMLATMTAGAPLAQVMAVLAREIGRDCRILGASGRQIAAAPDLPPLVERDLDAVTRSFLGARPLPAAATTSSGPMSLFPIGSGLGHRLGTWLLAVEGHHREWSPTTQDAIGEFATIAALERTRWLAERRRPREQAAEVLGLITAGAPPPELALRLTPAGVDPERPLVALVAHLEGVELVDGAVSVLDEAVLGIGVPLLATEADGHVVGLIQAKPRTRGRDGTDTAAPGAGDPDALDPDALDPDAFDADAADAGSAGLQERLRARLARLAPALERARLTVGLSGDKPVDALAGALDEARFAHRAACAGTEPVSVVSADEVTSHVLLLSTVPDDVRRAFAQRVLGPILEHDARSHSQLLETLEAFLDCSGSWARTSQALHLHANTVRYRIERIHELTGRDLSRLEDRVDFVLALKSR